MRSGAAGKWMDAVLAALFAVVLTAIACPPSTAALASSAVVASARHGDRDAAEDGRRHASKHGHRHKHKRRRVVVKSVGGALGAQLGALAVRAPPGAIRRGQTLTIEKGGSGSFPEIGAKSIAGGPYSVSTSQGEPDKPVKVSFSYDPKALGASGTPLVLHGWPPLGKWVPEPSKVTPGTRTVSAAVDSFSPLDVVDYTTWLAGTLTGNRTDLPGNCGEIPTWIDGASFPRERNDALPSCISNGTDAGALRVNIVNNRGYAQLVRVDGARIDIARSGPWSDSIDGTIAQGFARLNPANGPSSFVLSPGASATIAIARPSDLVGEQAVSIRAAPRGGSAAAHIAWAFLKELDRVKGKIGEPRNVANCVIGAIYFEASAEVNGASTLHTLHSCVDAATGLSGLAKATLKKIAGAILVTDVFHKVVDLNADEAFPARITFGFKGRGPTNPNIALGNLNLGTIPSGQLTQWQLTASGGTPPYEFAISTIPANQGRVPAWATLSPQGRLSVSPPASVNQYFSFYVFAGDATGRRSATGVYLVTFFAHSGTAGALAHVPAMDNQVHFSPNGAFALNFDDYDTDTNEEVFSLIDRRSGEVLRTMRSRYPDTLMPSPIADDGTMLWLQDRVADPLVTVYRIGSAPRGTPIPRGWAMGGVELSEDGRTFAVVTEEFDESTRSITLAVFDALTGGEIRHRTWTLDLETSSPAGELIPVQLFRLSPDGSSALVEACRSKVRDLEDEWSDVCDDYGVNATDRVLARIDLASMTYSSELVTTVTESPADWLPPAAISADGSTIELWKSASPFENLISRAGAVFPVPTDGAWCRFGASYPGPDEDARLYETLSGNGRYLFCNVGNDLRLVDLDHLTSVVVYSGPASELAEIEPLYVASDGGEVVVVTRYDGLLGPKGVYRWTP